MANTIHESKDGFTFISKTGALIIALCRNKILHS